MIGTAVATRHTSYFLKSLMGVIYGSTIRVFKEDTRSLDYSSYLLKSCLACFRMFVVQGFLNL